MNDEVIRAQINELIRDEIQEGINDYLDQQAENPDKIGFAKDVEDELKVNIPVDEVDKLIKEYKKIKKRKKSNFAQIKKLGLVDKHGKPLQ